MKTEPLPIVNVNVYVCSNACAYVCKPRRCAKGYVNANVNVYVCVRVCMHMCICMFMSIHAHMYPCV